MKQWIKELFEAAGKARFTGKIEINFNQGGIGSVKAYGERTLTESDVLFGTADKLYGWFGSWNSTTE